MLEEMPPFPERESSILAKLKKKKPAAVPEGTETKESKSMPQAHMSTSNSVREAPASLPVSETCTRRI